MHNANTHSVGKNKSDSSAAWIPDSQTVKHANLTQLIRQRGLNDFPSLQRWSAENRFEFWREMVDRLGIRFIKPYDKIASDEANLENPGWLMGAELNIADSCFAADSSSTAIVFAREDGKLNYVTFQSLEKFTNRVANGLIRLGIQPGDAIAIDMPMTADSVAIYLGIVRAGCVVVSIADSFAAKEIATRLQIANAKAIFTQDVILRAGKRLPLYEKVKDAKAPQAIVLSAAENVDETLRNGDRSWKDFLSDVAIFNSVPRNPNDHMNILFSSGTTGDPKAIPWTHATPIKCASDGWAHHDIHPGDVVCWPTNLGWMMGPWLIYATLINRATIALYEGAPNTRGFCEFVQDARVNMLGVVPSLVNAWRAIGTTQELDWSSIKVFSSTGECSNADEMHWLMSIAGNKPVIEYCGGTEVGGGYLTSTVIQPNVPSTFTTPAIGLDVVIFDENGRESNNGELFIVPPSIGLSTELLNQDHHDVYYRGTPSGLNGELLRRHGDEVSRLPNGYYQAMGRADDTMNLGGIKVSSAEMERVVNQLQGIVETAAVAIPPPGGGPDRLVIFVVPTQNNFKTSSDLQIEMQSTIKSQLNPLFRIHEVRLVTALPRTASNKVMRRKLRAEFERDDGQNSSPVVIS